MEPAIYDAWYQSARGNWIGQQEFSTLLKLFQPKAGQSLLDVGSGTGYFSRQFYQLGLHVTGLDPDPAMNDFAKSEENQINYIEGNALDLPFADKSFDYCAAITSLCFISEPEKALIEMSRVARNGIMLGLLNRHSLLYYKKRYSPGYQGARWDTKAEVRQWCNKLFPQAEMSIKSAVWIPSGGILARTLEPIIPEYYPYASFLAVGIKIKNG